MHVLESRPPRKGCKGLAYLYIKDSKEAPRPRKQTVLLSCLSSMFLLPLRMGPLISVPLDAKLDCPFPFLYYQFVQPFYKLKSYTIHPHPIGLALCFCYIGVPIVALGL